MKSVVFLSADKGKGIKKRRQKTKKSRRLKKVDGLLKKNGVKTVKNDKMDDETRRTWRQVRRLRSISSVESSLSRFRKRRRIGTSPIGSSSRRTFKRKRR